MFPIQVLDQLRNLSLVEKRVEGEKSTVWVHAQLVKVGQWLIAALKPQVYISNEARFGGTPRLNEVRKCGFRGCMNHPKKKKLLMI